MAWVGVGTGRLPLWLEGARCLLRFLSPLRALPAAPLRLGLGASPEDPDEAARPALERAMRAVLGQPGDLLPRLLAP